MVGNLTKDYRELQNRLKTLREKFEIKVFSFGLYVALATKKKIMHLS